jgi:serine/threonine protein phosphatase PrpC
MNISLNNLTPGLVENLIQVEITVEKIVENETIKKMWKNAQKAITEHRERDEVSYVEVNQGLPSCEALMFTELKPPLNFNFSEASKIGPRRTMEDAHFYKIIPQGLLTGVFDGHGGKSVAQLANQMFQDKFTETLAKQKGNVRETFVKLINEIHEEVIKDRALDGMGSTAVVCYIDKRTHLIYTATLADSEANIYRAIESSDLKSIPLSCVRDWSCKKEALRASISMGVPEIATEWPLAQNPKQLRYSLMDSVEFKQINVSRAIGDFDVVGTPEKPGLIHKPKITVNRVERGDILVLACDGLKDFVTEWQLISKLKEEVEDITMAEYLARTAVSKMFGRHGDNVTVVVINVS